MAKKDEVKDVKVEKVKVKKEKKEKVKKDSFLKETRTEMKQVRWPSGKEVLKYTLATIGLVLFILVCFSLITLLAAFIKEMFQ